MAQAKVKMEHKHEFFCLTCEIPKPFTGEELKAHLLGFHGLPGLKGRRKDMACLDFSDSYSNTWEWLVGGVDGGVGGVRVLETSSGPKGRR